MEALLLVIHLSWRCWWWSLWMMPLRHNWAEAEPIKPEPCNHKEPGVLPLHIHNCYPWCSKGGKSQPLSGSPVCREPLPCPGWDNQQLHGGASTFLRPHLVRKRPTELSWPLGVQLLEVPPGVAPQVVEVGPPRENSLRGHCSPSHSD